jgi:hypothetical protein
VPIPMAFEAWKAVDPHWRQLRADAGPEAAETREAWITQRLASGRVSRATLERAVLGGVLGDDYQITLPSGHTVSVGTIRANLPRYEGVQIPDAMLLGRKTEITLVLRTDWEGKDVPTEVSEELKGLPGKVKQGISKITRVMSAELTGRDFEISPSSRQERTIVPPQPVSWNWQVSPTETGESKQLKLRLYAHLQGAAGTMPPILVKTLDATIDVDVTTWDWGVNQARTLEPIYAIGAALLGLLTGILTYFLTRKREVAYSGGYREPSATATADR